MPRQKVGGVVLTFHVDDREMELLQTEGPSLNACRWSGLCIAEDQHDRFAISAKLEISTIQIHVSLSTGHTSISQELPIRSGSTVAPQE